MADNDTFDISVLGHQGDGIGNGPAGRAYVPFALAGERWGRAGTGFKLVGDPSADRRAPPCRHFGVCGGCVAQHMTDELYLKWKRQILVDAFHSADINASVEPMVTIAPGTRRRLVMTAMWLPSGVALGFHERGSDRLVTLTECVVSDPLIVEALPVLRQLAARLLPRREQVRVVVTRTDSGIDVGFEGAKQEIGAVDRSALADLLENTRILRVSVDGDPVIARSEPYLTVGAAKVVPPPGVFLQAAAPAEAVMIEHVVAAVGKAKRVCDLFSGLGTFALPLSRTATILAIDNDAKALAALNAAARNTQGLKPIETRQRDLMREPLSRKELEDVDAVVFDPPRAGAEAQAQSLAKSKVGKVVAVSCNPTTLARDVAILLDGGYELQTVTPIDQFLYSNHLEAIAVLVHGSKIKRKRA